jgi:hypothetical protein
MKNANYIQLPQNEWWLIIPRAKNRGFSYLKRPWKGPGFAGFAVRDGGRWNLQWVGHMSVKSQRVMT